MDQVLVERGIGATTSLVAPSTRPANEPPVGCTHKKNRNQSPLGKSLVLLRLQPTTRPLSIQTGPVDDALEYRLATPVVVGISALDGLGNCYDDRILRTNRGDRASIDRKGHARATILRREGP